MGISRCWRDFQAPVGTVGKPSIGFPRFPPGASFPQLSSCCSLCLHATLSVVLSSSALENLNLFLLFVRTAHYWTELHPELCFEEDINELLATHTVLEEFLLKNQEGQADSLSGQVAADLGSLQELRNQNATMVEAYEALAVDHQHVKEILQDRETNLRDVVAAMPAAVYCCDANGVIVYYNRQAVALWGCEPATDFPWSFLDACRIYSTDGTFLVADQRPVKSVIATGQPLINKELVLERPDSSRIDLLMNIAPLRDSAGRISGAVNIFQDISEIKRVQLSAGAERTPPTRIRRHRETYG